MNNSRISVYHANARVRAAMLLSVSLALSIGSLQANAQQYTLRPIPPIGGIASRGAAINARGQVVGISCVANKLCNIARNSTATKNLHAFFYSNGSTHDLGTLGGPDNYSTADGINANGDVVGTSNSSAHLEHAFIYSNGSMQDLGTLGGNNSRAIGINASGHVSGDSDTTGGAAHHAFLYSNGSMQDLGTLGGTNSYGTGINASSQMTGVSYLADNNSRHTFLYSAGSMQDLGSFGTSPLLDVNQGNAVNASGEVTGYGFNADVIDVAVVYRNGAFHDLGTINDEESGGIGIDAQGDVVGAYILDDGSEHAFLYRNGHRVDLNMLLLPADAAVYTLSDGEGINARGQILANGYKTAGSSLPRAYRAFVLTPVTSP